MSIRQLLLVLYARRRLVLAVFVAVTALGTALALLLPRQYTAGVALVIDAKSANAMLGQWLPPQMLSGYMATQLDVITSRRVTEAAARRPEVAGDETLRARWRADTEQQIPFDAWLGARLQREIEVTPGHDSNMVVISYTCREPERCARVANAVADAYIDTNLEMKVAPARQYAEWFDARTRGLREQLEASQRRLSDYQREHGIIASDERVDVETARLEELSRQLVTAQADHAGSRSRHTNSGGAETLPEVVQSPLIAGLKADLARLEARRDQSASHLGPNHPELRRIDSEIASLRKRIGIETKRIASSLGTADTIDAGRENELREAVAAQKAHVLDLKARRDEMAVLQKDVENAQRAYDLVTGRYAETHLESQAQQTNVSVLVPARAPHLPSSPRRALIVALSALLGVLLGGSLALALEMVRRRVRSEADVIEVLGVPVLGALPLAPMLPAARRALPPGER